MIPRTFEELRNKSIKDLESHFDDLADKDTQPSRENRSFLLNVISSKRAEEQGNRIEAMTLHMRNMTVMILILTAVNVAALVYQLFCLS